jgi:hypothetical protein
MAVYNEILSGRFNRALQKATSIKGPPPVRTLGSEILPVFPLFWGADMRYLESWDRFGAFISQAAGGAGNFAQIRLRNPLGSNVIAVFEKISWFNGDAAADSVALTVGVSAGDLVTGVALTANRWDPRGRPQPTLVASRGTPNVAPTANQGGFIVPAGTQYEIITTDIQEIPLLPGDQINIGTTTNNQTGNCTFWWRERFLEDSERT